MVIGDAQSSQAKDWFLRIWEMRPERRAARSAAVVAGCVSSAPQIQLNPASTWSQCEHLCAIPGHS